MARKFFYVCAGLFLLAVSYNLGARSAGAQSGGVPVASIDYGGDGLLANGVDATGRFSTLQLSDNRPAESPAQIPLPVSGQVIASWGFPDGTGNVYEAFVVYSGGTIYRYLSADGGWAVYAHLFGGGATASRSATWGQVKSTYRK